MPRAAPRAGDLLAVVAPSGPVPQERYARGLAVLRASGFRVKDDGVLAPPKRYLAADDPTRAAALAAAFADPEVAAIFVARGGYGAMRLLPSLDLAAAARSGKPLVGFSDVTALHLALWAHGARSVHGPVVTRLAEEPPESVERLFSLLAGERPAPLQGRVVVPGTVEGPLVGGCLSLVAALVGTPFLPDLTGCVLLLEEIDERPYRLDRMWTQLKLAGLLDRVAGIALGELVGCDEPEGSVASEVFDELLLDLGKPAIAGLPVGHGKVNLAVPHGARVRLEDGRLEFLEGLYP